MVARYCKMLMCLMLAGFAGIVAYDNLVDYGSNDAFVRHVLSMDTTFAGNALMDRAITTPALWRIAYGMIIAGEAATAILFAAAALALWRARNAASSVFQRAKAWAQAAGALGVALWFFGFEVVGGEWFAMWQSKVWNGQEAAFRFSTTLLAVLIFVSLPEPEAN